MAKDVVCGMEVDEQLAHAPDLVSVYQDQTYYFCAKGCKQAFDSQPEAYIKQQAAGR